MNNGFKKHKKMQHGLEVCVQLKYGSTDWAVMGDIQYFFPVELIDYVIIENLQKELDFALWLTYTEKNYKVIN